MLSNLWLLAQSADIQCVLCYSSCSNIFHRAFSSCRNKFIQCCSAGQGIHWNGFIRTIKTWNLLTHSSIILNALIIIKHLHILFLLNLNFWRSNFIICKFICVITFISNLSWLRFLGFCSKLILLIRKI